MSLSIIKKAIGNAIQMIFSPEPVWVDVADNKIEENGTFELGLKYAVIEFLTLFVSFQTSSYLINEYIKKNMPENNELRKSQVFAGYSSSLIYVLNLLIALINDLFFLWLFSVYTFYIVYVGSEIFYKINANKRSNFTIAATLFLMGAPFVVRYIFSIIIT